MQKAVGGADARVAWHHHTGDAQLAGKTGGVKRGGAAKRDQGAPAGSLPFSTA